MGNKRGPGTLDERIAALKAKLTEDQVASASVVAESNDDETVKLAYYLKSAVRQEVDRQKQIEKHQNAIAALESETE